MHQLHAGLSTAQASFDLQLSIQVMLLHLDHTHTMLSVTFTCVHKRCACLLPLILLCNKYLWAIADCLMLHCRWMYLQLLLQTWSSASC
jgi:hypothetical protein